MKKLLDIPADKALAAVVTELGHCPDCALYKLRNCYKKVACQAAARKDGKNVIFKMVDLNSYKQLLKWLEQNTEESPLTKEEIDELLSGVIK